MTLDSTADDVAAAHLISARLDAMHAGPLQVSVTDGPIFVLLAMASVHAGMLRPLASDCDDAAKALQRARPNGYVLAESTKVSGFTPPPRTFVSDYPDGSAARYAYVHVSERGLVEIVAGELADSRRQLVGLGGIEQSIRKYDALALRTAFDALGVRGRIVVTAALLGTQSIRVRSRETVPELDGILDIPCVRIVPRAFASPAQLEVQNLNLMVGDLWAKVTTRAN
ncbi:MULTISPECIES: hypothetical protein [Burkholderia]|jgi:hypothetical protein|uniref:Uncharacterized protein n=3 Tax=Burkholderia cepacia complex TaxID=87882 RepID=A0A250LNM1_9BURK|nr:MULTISPECIES: hypothetical protein [Burkholderia]MBA9831137.1 hypothetical protein [Burkholderia contaminans]MBA9906777.1 hypothetical protein [Burkholderia contaminans]MBX3822783.1 hypothetical protein [Burkholderia contaminans]MBX3843226.1 hypothetical protein [Burkholderia contaminans]MBX3861129.1 hypothetical protein [Burkholderia contaminans]